jgi:3-hydroxy acid dehydrogenase / malonic semialdehyde reductase
MKNKTVLITGATAGIGEACAIKFAEHKHNLILTGRRKEKLEKIAAKLKKDFGVEVLSLCFDIRKKEEVQNAIESLPGEWKKIDILINNAGLAAGLSSIEDGILEDWDQMIDTNIKGLLYISRFVAPLMIENNEGHIINIGSIAGREAYPAGNVYNATKFAVDGLTKAMRIDLFEKGIRVSQIAPGAVETEFSMVRFKGDSDRAAKVYDGYQALRAEDISDAAYYVSSLPPHVNINDLLIMPTAQATATRIHRRK